MNAALLIAGLGCVVAALGHETVGRVQVLPRLRQMRVPGTPSGTEAMVRVTWHIVTVFGAGIGALIVTIAVSASADARTLLLRFVAGIFVAMTAIVAWSVRRRPRAALRLPVWALWLVIAALCWGAST